MVAERFARAGHLRKSPSGRQLGATLGPRLPLPHIRGKVSRVRLSVTGFGERHPGVIEVHVERTYDETSAHAAASPLRSADILVRVIREDAALGTWAGRRGVARAAAFAGADPQVDKSSH